MVSKHEIYNESGLLLACTYFTVLKFIRIKTMEYVRIIRNCYKDKCTICQMFEHQQCHVESTLEVFDSRQ